MNIKELLKDREWLENKIVNEKCTSLDIAIEYDTTPLTVDNYRKEYGIEDNSGIKDKAFLILLKNKKWLENKIVNEGYSCSRLAKEYNSNRTTVDNYVQMHRIVQPLSQKELRTMSHEINITKDNPNMLMLRDRNWLVSTLINSSPEEIAESLGVSVNNVLYYRNLFNIKNSSNIGTKELIDTPQKIPKLKVIESKVDDSVYEYGIDYHISLPEQTLVYLNDREWLIDQHHVQQKTLIQMSSELGCDTNIISNYCKKYKIEVNYYYESVQQREVIDWLESLGLVVEVNNRNLIQGEIDIYLPDYKVGIEYCGLFWHCDIHERMTNSYHLKKLRQCQKEGIRLLTLYEDEWLDRKEQVKNKILSILGKSSGSIFARKCTIVQITDRETKRVFFDTNHIQGDGPGSITIGLSYQGNIVAMMTFIKKLNGVFDLNRFASSIRVVGGFQKILKYFLKNHDWEEILSFADLRWSLGNMYAVSGFKLDNTLQPDYRYVIDGKAAHKFKYRRKYLETFLPNFVFEMSEVQNMRAAGYYRIFNCGLLRYVLKNNK